MTVHRPSRMAWLGALLGLGLALALFAPALWLAQAVSSATQGQLQLVNARGTVWHGQADVLLTGGQDSQTRTSLPQGVRWRLSPALLDSVPGLALQLELPCCSAQPVAMTLGPRDGDAELRLGAASGHGPAGLLAGLGTPWNTLRLEGRLNLRTEGLTLRWHGGRGTLQGALALEAYDLASRLSTLRPLGSYRIELHTLADDGGVAVSLSTLSGRLQLQGQGRWVDGRLRFGGVAEAAPDSEAALANLLNIIGRRQGTRSLLDIG